jgi:hypothetical protein
MAFKAVSQNPFDVIDGPGRVTVVNPFYPVHDKLKQSGPRKTKEDARAIRAVDNHPWDEFWSAVARIASEQGSAR